MMKQTMLIIAMMFTATCGMAKDIKTVVFTTSPQMHCESCENKIKGNLRFEKGVKNIETNIEKQQVVVTYDADKTSVEKLQRGFEKIGYDAKEVKAVCKQETASDASCEKHD
ncbi:heavy-metal-associated domain-containing protein [Prevotella sp. Rep29]|uniref:heavy-metal-associated domain-containing protein n=1 Tax=Prevotella sp. Rep29 TaxID=2691580 RepID=UPI00351D40A2